MSYIPPLVCDTPPPIDYDAHLSQINSDSQCETLDDFGDGMFSNYDGSSLPTTPKQISSANDHDDLPLDIPDLTHVQHFPRITENDAAKNHDLKDSFECAANVTVLQSNHLFYNNESPQPPPPPPIISNSQMDNNSNETPRTEDEIEPTLSADMCSNAQVKDLPKLNIKHQSLENSSSSQSNSNDNVCRSESPPSLVFSAESLNCDDNQSEDFEEFQQNTDDVECNFPSLKLDSISDTKSQSSDLDETSNLAECESDGIRDNVVEMTITRDSDTNVEIEVVKDIDIRSATIEHSNVIVTNGDDSFDDFVEFESNVAASEKCDFVEQQAVVAGPPYLDDVDVSTESIGLKDENVFAADFSQFEMHSENTTNEPMQRNITKNESEDFSLNRQASEKPSTLTDAADDFNDFENADDDDDEFGEFNDFSDFSQPQTFVSPLTTNIEELSAKIKPLLDSLFPSSDNDDGSYDAFDLTNDTTRIIKDFENSKALDHQWTSSLGRSSLVTALGIDSRNILYGGKWNSSMPRFAANLGFSPLEPMKPSSVSGTTSSSNSAASNEIPAAQFDWNSSGLTNPLDASHAHTLLLDLEQLVVVANLDKIKLDSSTCSSTSIPATSKSTTNNNSMSSLNNHYYIHNCDDGVGYQYNGDFYGNSLPYSCETNIKTLDKNPNHFGLFDQFLDIRVQEILHKTNAAENQSSRAELDWHSTKTEPPSLVAQTAPHSNIHTTLKNINATSFIVSEEPTQTSASYVVPGSGTLKETHIFTPSKSPYSIPQSRDVVQSDKQESKCPDFDYEKAAAGIIIDENVVKKEYRDLEYDPDKPTASALSSSDDFSDFQSVPIPIAVQNPHRTPQNMFSMDYGILQPTKRNDSITINWPDPGNVVTSTNLESFDSFKSVGHAMSSSSTDFGINEKPNSSSSSSFGDFAKPVIGVSPSEAMFETNSVSVEDEFSDFQSVEPITSHNKLASVIPNHPSPPINDAAPSNKVDSLRNNIPDNTSIVTSDSNSSHSKNWTDFQSPNFKQTPIATNVPLANILQPAPLQPLQILTPQPVNLQPSLHTNTIWPESEIDPDEIARLEAIFPQTHKQSSHTDYETKSQNPNPTKPQEDDEWSDFVSVSTPASQPLPITNIISANLVKHQQDDDEWSDFVSTQPTTQWNVNSGPNFTSWNAPPQFSSWQSSTLFQQPQQFVPTLPPPTTNQNPSSKTNPNSFFTQKAPSISLIPDLSFVAPKSLVNRSRTNYPSK